MPPPFRPVVQQGDFARIVNAHGEMFRAKGIIYQFHAQIMKIAGMRNAPLLKAAATVWLDHSDMIVSTSFDVEHFEAQIKDRTARGLGHHVPEMQAIQGAVQGRLDNALANVEDAEVELERQYVDVVSRGAEDSEARTNERTRIRQIFEVTYRKKAGLERRPDKIPEPRKRKFRVKNKINFQVKKLGLTVESHRYKAKMKANAQFTLPLSVKKATKVKANMKANAQFDAAMSVKKATKLKVKPKQNAQFDAALTVTP